MACNCYSIVPTVVTIPPACPTDCLRAAHFRIDPADSIAPCGDQITWDLDDWNAAANSFCTGTLTYQVWEHDSVFSNVSFTGSEITVQIDSGLVGSYHQIVYRMYCGEFSAYGTITVGIKNLCFGVQCAQGTVCNECSGLCDAEPLNLTVTGGSGSVSTPINLIVT